MRIKSVFLGFVGLALLALPLSAQPREDDPETKALAAKLAADPALSLAANAAFLANNARQPGVNRRPSGLQFKILQNGFGKHPSASDTVEVYYTGKLINGQVFDGTSPGLPATFNVTRDGLVQGWVEALQLMREGDHWTVWIPANLGYGARPAAGGMIPPNQTLVFDLRLLSTRTPPKLGDPGCATDPACAAEMQQGRQ
jgi:FKBP-type peptidyl-prolyl cis-trans isomerase